MSPPNPVQSEPAAPAGDRLICTLTLTIKGTAYKIPGGQIKRVALDLRSYGFTGEVEFVLHDDKALGGGSEDKLLAAFVKPDLVTVELSLRGARVDAEPDTSASPLKVKGLVTHKQLEEFTTPELRARGTLFRRYVVQFSDAALLLLSMHYPCELYVQKTLKDVLDAHKGDLVQLTYDWTLLTKTRPLIFLGHDPAPNAPSFYDFLIWLVDTQAGVLTYDYAAQALKLAAEKASITAVKTLPEDIDRIRLDLPAPPRAKVNILNSYTEGAKSQPADWTDTTVPAGGIREDYLLRTPIAAEIDARVTLEKSRLKSRGPELRVQFHRFPQNPLRPGDGVDFAQDAAWRAHRLVVPAPFAKAKARIFALHVTAEAVDQSPDRDAGFTQSSYHVKAEARLELESEKHVPLPAYRPPIYPRTVEGKIVSEEGQEKDETYQIYPDADTSVDLYKVKIPLWSNQIITIDYQPTLFPGQFYFPAYKGQRVLVALGFDRAWLVRYLDWRAESRLPSETQGNHLLLGKTSQTGVSIRHVYEDDKPVLRIKRTNNKDTAVIQIMEGNLMIKVKEEE